MPLNIFGFEALWSPVFIISTLVVIAIYFFITIKNGICLKGTSP